ncbi:MAG: cupin domain-containing protein [Candidatus Heimdallarchaeota archaeon]
MKIRNIKEEKKKAEEFFFRSQDRTIINELEKNKDFSIAYGELKVGEKTKRHVMEMTEMYYILEGEGKLTVNKDNYELAEDMYIKVPPDSIQQLENTGKINLRFLCIVTPPYDPENELILD